MSYWAERGHDVDDIINWSYYKRATMMAIMEHNIEIHQDELIAISPKLDFPKEEPDDGWENI